MVTDYTHPTDNLPPRAPPSVDCQPYFIDSGAPGRGPLLGVVRADLPANQMAIFFINVVRGNLICYGGVPQPDETRSMPCPYGSIYYSKLLVLCIGYSASLSATSLDGSAKSIGTEAW